MYLLFLNLNAINNVYINYLLFYFLTCTAAIWKIPEVNNYGNNNGKDGDKLVEIEGKEWVLTKDNKNYLGDDQLINKINKKKNICKRRVTQMLQVTYFIICTTTNFVKKNYLNLK